jgi:Abnormal spindle-like microcephaly-assoc'd, ASPM-SPD-2-Hydin
VDGGGFRRADSSSERSGTQRGEHGSRILVDDGSGMGTTIGQLTISPATLNLGSVTVGSTGTQTGVLSATGGSVTITSVASSNSQFTVLGVSLPLTISAGQSVHFNVAFTPQSTGTTSAKLSFASNATNSLALESLAGTARGALCDAVVESQYISGRGL